MDSARSLEAYVKLLVHGEAVHAEPGRALAGPDGAPLATELAVRTRTVVLAGVFKDPDETFNDQVFSAARFGGVGTLTVLPDISNPKLLEDAWLHVNWSPSAHGMLSELLRVPGLLLHAARIKRDVEILVAGALVDERPDLLDDIERLTLLVGGNPAVHHVTPKTRGAVQTKVRANNPYELIVLGAPADEAIVAEFTRRNGDRHLHRAPEQSADRALQWLLDALPHIMGIGPGLIRHREVSPEPGRPRMPVADPVRCLHHGDNRYVLDGATGEWWTRDFAQHGSAEKTIFKTFALVSGELLWRADRDGSGEVIDGKHKGATGAKIYERDTGSCGHPESHLH